MSAPARSARSRFAALADVPESDVDLAAAALAVAAEEYPQLPAALYVQRLDQLAERVRDRLADESAPLVVLQELSRVLAQEEGFRGNEEDYYDARNCYLNDVLDRRVGIPITLAIVWLEIGWRLGLPLAGVNFPGHFLIRYEGAALKVLVDPFYGGRIRFEDEAHELLEHAYGGGVAFDPRFLRPAGKKDILVRLLANLKGNALRNRDDARALAAIERILIIRPDALDEVRDRGMVLARLGRNAEALPELYRYLNEAVGAEDEARVRLLVRALEAEHTRERPA